MNYRVKYNNAFEETISKCWLIVLKPQICNTMQVSVSFIATLAVSNQLASDTG